MHSIKTYLSFLPLLVFVACASREHKPTRSVEVSFQSEGVTISGILWLPEGEGPFPAMVLGHGSGRSTMHAARFPGQHFSQSGIAFLSYDKRGVNKSGGQYVGRNNTSEDNLKLLAKDISAGVTFLRDHKDINPDQIGLWGVSQAGWILPIVATEVKNIKFSILISGPTVKTGEENVYSRLTGDTEGQLLLTQKEVSKIIAEEGQYGFDPLPYLEEMQMPGLWLLGEKDESIPIPETVNNLEKLISKGRKFKYHVFPGANHGLRVDGRIVNDYWTIQDDFLNKVVGIPTN